MKSTNKNKLTNNNGVPALLGRRRWPALPIICVYVYMCMCVYVWEGVRTRFPVPLALA